LKAAGALFVLQTNLSGALTLDVGDFIAVHFDELRPQLGRRHLRSGGEYLDGGGCHALSAVLNRAACGTIAIAWQDHWMRRRRRRNRLAETFDYGKEKACDFV